jgi:hypothetical protein
MLSCFGLLMLNCVGLLMLICFGLLLICFVILKWRLTESTVTMVTMATKSDLHQRRQLSVVSSLSYGPILVIFWHGTSHIHPKTTTNISNLCLYSLMSYDCHTTRARKDTLFIMHDIVLNSSRAVDWGGGRPGDSRVQGTAKGVC